MLRVLIAAGLLALSGMSAAEAAPAQFKGINTLSKELSARIAVRESPIELDRFMPADGLDDLTGTWAAFGVEHAFQNGQPNAVNMVLLRLALSRFAKALAATCKSPQFILNETFIETLEALCTWPSAEAKTETVMQGFWLAMMGYNAPRPEYQVWREFVLRTYEGKKAKDALEGMTLAIVLNPYFLLQQ
jgi:hypothetical protein